MIEVLDKELNITVLVLENNPNTYYLSYQKDAKCIISIVQNESDIIIIPNPMEHCTAEELTKIINCFSNYIFKIYPNVNGILLKTDDNQMLESIGFKLISDDSEYLYKENNKRIKKVR